MKRSLLERAQRRLFSITPRALGKNEYILPLASNLLRRALKRLQRIIPVTAIDKHRPAERHVPSQERYQFERGLGRDGAVGREDGAEEQDIEFGLVVPDDDARAGVQVLLSGHDVEFDTGGQAHAELEGARGPVLGEAVLAD